MNATQRIEADFNTAFKKITGLMPSEIEGRFNDWWKKEGQYICASGQPDQKKVIFDAWISGWESLNQLGVPKNIEELKNATEIGLACAIAYAGKCEAKGESIIAAQAVRDIETIRNALGR